MVEVWPFLLSWMLCFGGTVYPSNKCPCRHILNILRSIRECLPRTGPRKLTITTTARNDCRTRTTTIPPEWTTTTTPETTTSVTTPPPTVTTPFSWRSFSSPCSSGSIFYGDDTTQMSPIFPPYFFPFFSFGHRTIWISTNGLISFNGRRRSPFSSPFPSQFARNSIAAMWTDIVAYSGKVCYKVYSNYEDMFTQIDNDVATHTQFTGYNTNWVLIIEWNDVQQSPHWLYPNQRATVQLVLASDGELSFAYMIYKDITWQQILGRNYIVGWNSPASVYNNPYSNHISALSLHLLNGNTGLQGVWFHPLVTERYQRAGAQCNSWYRRELRFESTYNRLANLMRCPCGRWGARFNRGWLRWIRGTNCYIFQWWLPYTKTCCYGSWDQLERSIPRAGHLLRYHPGFDRRRYIRDDVIPKRRCCTESNNCQKFYRVRPRGSFCRWWNPFSIRWFWGDPHIETLDGLKYTFNGLGEYILMRLNSANDTGLLAGRTALAESSAAPNINATVWSAFGFRDSRGASFHVGLNKDKTSMVIYINDVDRTRGFYNDGTNFTVDDPVIYATNDNDMLVLSLQSGLSFTFKVAVKMLTVSININQEFNGKTEGLLGTLDGNTNNDLMEPDGTPVSQPATEREIFEFGQKWVLDPKDSAQVFKYYHHGETPQDYIFPDFVPSFLEELTTPAKQTEAESICNSDKQCIFDYLATGSSEIANNTKIVNIDAEADNKVIENSAPQIFSDKSLIEIEVGNTATWTYSTNDSDSGDTVSYRIDSQPADGFIFNNNTGEASWMPGNTDPVEISIGAIDSNNAATEPIVVDIVVCDCSGNGTCLYDQATEANTTSSGSFSVAACDCNPGYTGDTCNLLETVCDKTPSPCRVNNSCVDLLPTDQASFNRTHNCTACLVGWEVIDGKCIDINECDTNPCDQLCINTDGSYICDCNDGYRLGSAGCEDNDECIEKTSGCQQKCVNTPGSFTCECIAGSLNADNKTCTIDLSPCVAVGLSCNQSCSNATGTPQCFCDLGYTANGEDCSDFNECLVSSCSQKCTNSIGSFACSCLPGYYLDKDKVTCKECELLAYGDGCSKTCDCADQASRCDHVLGCICLDGWRGENCDVNINECDETAAICSSHLLCADTQGSYTCNCPTGYTKEADGSCADINECADTVTNDCELVTEQCVNTIGSYSCLCASGYTRDGLNCTDVDECEIYEDACEQTCENKVGTYNCYCKAGYIITDDRRTCTPDPSLKDSVCTDSTCSYGCQQNSVTLAAECFCKRGYKLAEDGQNCIDEDECLQTPKVCSQICTNSEGGYTCSCAEGYYLDNDIQTCNACDSEHWGSNCANDCNCGIGSQTCDKLTGCVCKSGWTGTTCGTDINECTLGTVTCTSSNSVCTNTPGSAVCQCRDGYKKGLNDECQDINECNKTAVDEIDTKHCTQICTNTDGSYVCDCENGFHLATDKLTCVDTDECTTGQHQCSQKCRNTIGGYACSCYAGFDLDPSDLKTCIAKVNCTITTCSQNCRVDNAIDVCFCNNGYSLNVTDNSTCTDIDECTLSSPCNQVCNNTDGSYECSCQAGYKLESDGVTCLECNEGYYGENCNKTCDCVNENTNYCNKVDGKCNCTSGWEGAQCQTDINECEPTSPCQNYADCINVNGSHSCRCNIGYIEKTTGSVTTCEVCDEGYYGSGCVSRCNCSSNTVHCNPVNGSCEVCVAGFEGTQCEININDCTSTSCAGKDNTVCVDKIHSFACDCASGYKKNDNGTCVDVDECFDSSLHNCSDARFCGNTVGSFTCSLTNKCINRLLCSTCQPGSYRNTSYFCVPCAVGYYQDQVDQSQCIACAGSRITFTDSADSKAKCVLDCSDGKEYNENSDSCVYCSVGYYRAKADSTTCQECPTGKTTSAVGAKLRTECTGSAHTYSVTIKVSMNETGIDFSDPSSARYQNLSSQFKDELEKYYSNGNSKFMRVNILSIQPGLKVVHELVAETSDSSLQNLAKSLASLPKETLSIDNTNVSIAEAQFGDNTYTDDTDACTARTYIDACESGYTCSDGSCVASQDSTDDDWKLIVGLAVGLPLGILAILLCCFWLYLCRRRRDKDTPIHSLNSDDVSDHTGSRYFSAGIGRRNWVTQADQLTKGFGLHRDPALKPPSIDSPRSTFSWDFMNKYLHPDEDFEIQRPHVALTPISEK